MLAARVYVDKSIKSAGFWPDIGQWWYLHQKQHFYSTAMFLAPTVTVGETEGAMDSASGFFPLFFCLFVRK